MSESLVVERVEAVAVPRVRADYIDVLRVAATVAVVMIHVSGQGVVHTESVTRIGWWVANVYDSMSRWSVPVFVMISGALLLEPTKQTMGAFYKRRVMRVGVPLLAWSVFFLVYRRFYLHEPLTWKTSLATFFTGNPSFHLYFLFLILGLYLFTPMFRTFVRYASRRELVAMTALALVFSSVDHLLRQLMGMWFQPTAFEMFVPFVGYYLAGYVLAHTPGSTLGRVTSWAMLIGGLTITILGVGLTKTIPKMNVAIEVYYEYPSPSVVLMTLAVFALVQDFYRRKGRGRAMVASVCQWIAPACLGIYLMHPIGLMEIFKRYGTRATPMNELVAAPLWTGVLFLGCLWVTKVVQRIPGVRWVMG